MISVEVSRTIDAPPAVVYRAFLDPDKLRRWFCPAEIFELVPDERIVLSWRFEDREGVESGWNEALGQLAALYERS